jgi:glycosyltransferase involved in cell wall biosynthesis
LDGPTFAIVIPTLDEESNLERLLQSLNAQLNRDFKVAIVDQGSRDDTCGVAERFGCTVVKTPRPGFRTPPGQARNLGVKAIPGRIVLHLDADMEVGSPSFLDDVAGVIDVRHQAAVIHEDDVPTGYWARCKALERRCYAATAIESARVVTRDLFAAIGGYDPEIFSGEDAFISAIYEQRTSVVRISRLRIRHHTGPYTLRSLLLKKLSYGRTVEAYIRRSRSSGAKSPVRIVTLSLASYARNWRLARREPLLYLSILPMRALEFLAICAGLLLGSGRRGAVLGDTV